MKKIILTIVVIILAITGYYIYQKLEQEIEINNKTEEQNIQKQIKEINQDFSLTGYNISLKYNSENWNAISGDGKDAFNYYGSSIRLTNKKDKEIYIEVSYEKDLRPQKQKEAETEDTGGPATYPPIIEDLTDEFEFVRELGGYKLYIRKKPRYSVVIFQEFKKNKLTKEMNILNQNKEEPTTEEYTTFVLSFNEKLSPELKQEFIDIVKSIKIEKIK